MPTRIRLLAGRLFEEKEISSLEAVAIMEAVEHYIPPPLPRIWSRRTLQGLHSLRAQVLNEKDRGV